MVEELEAKLKGLEDRLAEYKTQIASLEAKVSAYEETMCQYVFTDKKPDYVYSFSGHIIFKCWCSLNGVTSLQAEIMVIMTYIEVFLFSSFGLFQHKRLDNYKRCLGELITNGYVIEIKVPAKNAMKNAPWRRGWVLTQKGKDFEADYEKFYDQKMEERKAGKFTQVNFEDGAYFRRLYVPRFIRRAEQGGGKLPRRPATHRLFINAEDVGK